MKRALREHSLALFFGAIFLGALIGQALTGVAQYNSEQLSEGLQQVSLLQYLTSSSFAVDVAENWQSEFLQFLLYIYATVWFFQKGSPESKELDKPGLESDRDQQVAEYSKPDSPAWAKVRGFRLELYSRSLGLTMAAIFLACWGAQFIAGRSAYNEDQLNSLQDPVGWWAYFTNAEFWNRTLQNWQSEFLAVATFAVLSIYLRQRGSSQSKPVGSPHSATGVEG